MRGKRSRRTACVLAYNRNVDLHVLLLGWVLARTIVAQGSAWSAFFVLVTPFELFKLNECAGEQIVGADRFQRQ